MAMQIKPHLALSLQVKRHKIEGIRRLAAHSHLPLCKYPPPFPHQNASLSAPSPAFLPPVFPDVTGCQDGSIRMWEWSHAQPVQSVRPPGVFAKVNRVRFTSQGNKFGACDGDGNVALWQAANASQPFFVRNIQGDLKYHQSLLLLSIFH